MDTTQRIIITGFMGAGKTTVARALAQHLKCSHVDLDGFIAAREKRTVPLIIDEDGLVKFRVMETQALRDVLREDAARVIALGGGAWTIARNRSLISRRKCFTVWLDAPFKLCWQRIMREDSLRPLARDRNEAQELYTQRCALYKLAALHVKVDEAKDAKAIAAEITRALSPN
jgi:shikimate kinase